jgi:hypothetical protein
MHSAAIRVVCSQSVPPFPTPFLTLRFCVCVCVLLRRSACSDDGSDFFDSQSTGAASYAPQTIREIISPPACYKQRVFGVVDILCMEDSSNPTSQEEEGVTFADEQMRQELVARSGSDDGSGSSAFSSNAGSDSMSVLGGGMASTTLGTVPEEEFSTTSSRSNQISHEMNMSDSQLNGSNPQAHERSGSSPADITNSSRPGVPSTSLLSLTRGKTGSDYSESETSISVQ